MYPGCSRPTMRKGRFRSFLSDFWRLSRQSGRIRFVREVDGMLPRVFRPDQSVMRNAQVEPFGMINVDCHGQCFQLLARIAGAQTCATTTTSLLATSIRTRWKTCVAVRPMIAMTRDIAAGVEACRKECEYFSVCGGGAPVNKLAENGSFHRHAHVILQPDPDGADRPHS